MEAYKLVQYGVDDRSTLNVYDMPEPGGAHLSYSCIILHYSKLIQRSHSAATIMSHVHTPQGNTNRYNN